MLIAISSKEPQESALVDEHFGRAQYFMLYDTCSKTWQSLDNTASLQAPHGAGINTAQVLLDKQVTVVITGQVGPKARRVLADRVLIYSCSADCSVNEAIVKFNQNELIEG